jgi:NACHT domain
MWLYLQTKRKLNLFWYSLLQANGANSLVILGIDEKSDQAQQDRLLATLPCVAAAAFTSYDHQYERKCLPDTRIDLLRLVTEWADSSSGKCIFWLNGMAGTGKSTIARTVAQYFTDKNRLGASFFFSKGSGDRGQARHFFTTIAVQMARALPSVRTYISEAIAKEPGIAQQAMFEQWSKLILQPLRTARDRQAVPRPIILVVDALDECGNQKDIRLILRLLAGTKDLTTVSLRILVTSRPETPIRLGFREMSTIKYEDLILHNISRSVVDNDIYTFLKHELGQIRSEYNLPVNWPKEQELGLLVQKANCLFIYAATACLYIHGPPGISPKVRLSNLILGYTDDGLSTRNLDNMYMQILKDSVAGEYSDVERRGLATQFQLLVGSIVVLFDALSAAALSRLLFQPGAESIDIVNMTLDPLQSVLSVPEDTESPVMLLHPSFRDFLLDRHRCSDDQFWIDRKQAHSKLARSCLEFMSRSLKKNICGLPSPGSLAADIEGNELIRCVPLPLQYACRYWVDHLEKSDIDLFHDKAVEFFLQDHFLHWLEALSVMRIFSEGLTMIMKIGPMLKVSQCTFWS